jgi:alkylated DNA nucleotide flippase Atl1
MGAGRVEEAGQLAKLIGKQIARNCSQSLARINGKADAKELWTAVRQLTGRVQEVDPSAGISAETLNTHYANMVSKFCAELQFPK